jgi:hypothetical protein
MQKSSWSGSRAGLGALTLMGLMWCRHASAEDTPTRCPVPEGADSSLARVDAGARLDFLHETLDEQAHYAHNWRWWWFAIGDVTLASSVAFTFVGAATNDQPNLWDRPDFVDGIIVSAFSIVTPLSALVLAPRAEGDAADVDRLFAQTGNGRAGECEVLARTEEIFSKTAEEEAFNTSWLLWAASIVGNAAMFGIMAVEAATTSDPGAQEAHWRNAIINTASGLVLTAAQILTSPTGAVSGWRRYMKGNVQRKSGVAFSVAPFGFAPGLALSLRF